MENDTAHLEPDKEKADEPLPRTPCCASLIVHDPADLPKCDGEILVALWGANEWEIVNVRENVNGPFSAEYKSTGDLADPSEWQWWADLHCMILHNVKCAGTATSGGQRPNGGEG
jgi:hypothetical protein